jgi:hypothetical protein
MNLARAKITSRGKVTTENGGLELFAAPFELVTGEARTFQEKEHNLPILPPVALVNNTNLSF